MSTAHVAAVRAALTGPHLDAQTAIDLLGPDVLTAPSVRKVTLTSGQRSEATGDGTTAAVPQVSKLVVVATDAIAYAAGLP
jgi:hypothetical protein